MQQVVVLNAGTVVEKHMLPDAVKSGHLEQDAASTAIPAAPATAIAPVPEAAPTELAHVVRRQQVEPLWLTEKRAIEGAIDACNGNVNQAAGLLEVAPSTLYRKLQSWKKQPA